MLLFFQAAITAFSVFLILNQVLRLCSADKQWEVISHSNYTVHNNTHLYSQIWVNRTLKCTNLEGKPLTWTLWTIVHIQHCFLDFFFLTHDPPTPSSIVPFLLYFTALFICLQWQQFKSVRMTVNSVLYNTVLIFAFYFSNLNSIKIPHYAFNLTLMYICTVSTYTVTPSGQF